MSAMSTCQPVGWWKMRDYLKEAHPSFAALMQRVDELPEVAPVSGGTGHEPAGAVGTLVLVACSPPCPPVAAQLGVTLYVGYIGSNGIDNVTDNTSASIKSSRPSRRPSASTWIPRANCNCSTASRRRHCRRRRRRTVRPDGRYCTPAARRSSKGRSTAAGTWWAARPRSSRRARPGTARRPSRRSILASVTTGRWQERRAACRRPRFLHVGQQLRGLHVLRRCIVVLRSETFLQYEAMLASRRVLNLRSRQRCATTVLCVLAAAFRRDSGRQTGHRATTAG